MWPALEKLDKLEELIFRGNSKFSIVVNGNRIISNQEFINWTQKNIVKLNDTVRTEKGLLLFVFFVLENPSSLSAWVANEDENGDVWNSKIRKVNDKFFYNDKILTVTAKSKKQKVLTKKTTETLSSNNMIKSNSSNDFELIGTLINPIKTKFQGVTFQLQAPLIFGIGKLSNKQTVKSPIILLNRKDLNKLDKIMTENDHAEAFGRDYDSYSNSNYQNIDTVLWKIPGDILDIEYLNYRLMDNIGLQVGTYPAWIDNWSGFPDKMIRIFDVLFTATQTNKATDMTKLRFDFTEAESCHVLTNLKTGTTLPMLGTHFYFTYHWDNDYKNKEQLKKHRQKYLDAIVDLQKIGVKALSIREQQHALVFVELHNKPITMSAFIKFLKENKEQMRLALHLKPIDYDDWFDSYITFDTDAFNSNRWNKQ